MSNGVSFIQTVARSLPLAGSLLGMVLILGSIALFVDSDYAKVAGAMAGIMALLGAVWYAAHPFLKSTRRYVLLRTEVVRLIDIARGLNVAVTKGASADDIARTRAELHDAVDRMVAAAGKTQTTRG